MKKAEAQVTDKSSECRNCECEKGSGRCGNVNYHRSAAGTASASGGLYGLGFVGALVYFVSTATTFGMGVLGVLKALVWPAFLVYELMKMLHM